LPLVKKIAQDRKQSLWEGTTVNLFIFSPACAFVSVIGMVPCSNHFKELNSSTKCSNVGRADRWPKKVQFGIAVKKSFINL